MTFRVMDVLGAPDVVRVMLASATASRPALGVDASGSGRMLLLTRSSDAIPSGGLLTLAVTEESAGGSSQPSSARHLAGVISVDSLRR